MKFLAGLIITILGAVGIVGACYRWFSSNEFALFEGIVLVSFGSTLFVYALIKPDLDELQSKLDKLEAKLK